MKTLLAISLLTLASGLHAETWKDLGYYKKYESRLILDTDSYNLAEYKLGDNSKSIRVLAKFRLVNASGKMNMTSLIDANQCVADKHGVIVVLTDNDRLDDTWSYKAGRKEDLQDLMGMTLCNHIIFEQSRLK